MDKIKLSYSINSDTPLYGGKHPSINKSACILDGKSVNETKINTTVHIGTHIDFPYHFYEHGQTIEDFPIDFWFFEKVLVIEVKPTQTIIETELIEKLNSIQDIGYEFLIVKTGMGKFRNEKKYWAAGYGFSPNIYIFLKEKFPSIKVMGFDLISITSYLNRELGKEAHRAFLNPNSPILLLEDMDLSNINKLSKIKELIVSPLFIEKCDGLPCTVYGILKKD